MIVAFNQGDIISRIRKTRRLFEKSQVIDAEQSFSSPEIFIATPQQELTQESSIEIARNLAVMMKNCETEDERDRILSSLNLGHTWATTGPRDSSPMIHEQPGDDDESGDHVDVTRIILGNADNFLDSFPYFTRLIDAWIEVFDPAIAFTVLDAVPAALTKKPAKIQPILKYLYGQISLNLFTESVATANLTCDVSCNRTTRMLHILMKEAPKLIRISVEKVESRVCELRGIFNLTVSQPLPVIGASRMLTEVGTQRIKLRRQLLLDYINDGFIDHAYPKHPMESLLEYPRLLTQPLSVIKGRIPFAARALALLSQPSLSISRCHELIDCNTIAFLDMLSVQLSKKTEALADDYAAHLRGLIADSETGVDCADDVNALEGHLCGLLNAMCDGKYDLTDE